MVLDEPKLDLASEESTPVTIVDLPTPGRATQYVLGLQNFYVLTRYNRSFFYALAVYELGQRVKASLEEADGTTSSPASGASAPAEPPRAPAASAATLLGQPEPTSAPSTAPASAALPAPGSTATPAPAPLQPEQPQ
jgi:membrane-bound lytic murein transglycosylase B